MSDEDRRIAAINWTLEQARQFVSNSHWLPSMSDQNREALAQELARQLFKWTSQAVCGSIQLERKRCLTPSLN